MSSAASEKKPFDIKRAMRLLRKAVKDYPKATLFELAKEGHSSVFEILVACILSIRTRDETTLPVARQLFAHAPTPEKMAALSPVRARNAPPARFWRCANKSA